MGVVVQNIKKALGCLIHIGKKLEVELAKLLSEGFLTLRSKQSNLLYTYMQTHAVFLQKRQNYSKQNYVPVKAGKLF